MSNIADPRNHGKFLLVNYMHNLEKCNRFCAWHFNIQIGPFFLFNFKF